MVSLVLIVMASPAFAQATVVTPSPPVLTTATAVTMVLSALLGLITQMVQTGTFLGRWVTPKTWLPSLTVAATFLGGIVSYLASQSPLVLNSATVFYAVMFGITALFAGSVPAMAVHAHVVVPGQVRAHLNAVAAAAAAPPPSKANQAGFIRKDLLRALAFVAVLGVVVTPAIVRHRSSAATTAQVTQVASQESVEPEAVEPVIMGAGCSWWSNGGGSQTQTSGTVIALCVFEQLLQGVTQPDAIATACDSIALSQLLNVLDSILNYYVQPPAPDAGVADGGAPMLCGVGTPPVMGAPTCVPASLVTQAKGMRAATAAKMAAAH